MAQVTDWAHGEDDVRLPILEVLSQGGSRTTLEITKAVRARLNLTSVDLLPAAKRQNEQKINQIVANALQKERKLCASGLVERVEIGVFRLTPKGDEFLKKFNDDVALAVAWLDETFPNLE